MDPVEVFSLFCTAMDGKSLDEVDVDGKSPLHYAASVGAVVSCMLLIQVRSAIKPAAKYKGEYGRTSANVRVSSY